MLSNKINKSYFWLLTVCLLILVSIVLIITAFAQFKYNIILGSNYKAVSYSKEDSDMDKISKENVVLKDTISDLQKELKSQNEKYNELEQEYKSNKEKNAYVLNVYEGLIKSEILRQQGDLIGSADSIRLSVNTDYLLPDAREMEKKIRNEAFGTAAEFYYSAGINYFNNSNYDEAINRLNRSLYYITNENFKVDCLYLLVKSYYLNGQIEKADSAFKILFNEFPESSYTAQVSTIFEDLKR